MIEKKDNILFIANLQVFATPYASLYLDTERNVLCIFVRTTSPQSSEVNYAVADVTSAMVSKYLNKKLGLDDMLSSFNGLCANIRNNVIYFEHKHCLKQDNLIKKARLFNPEYCEDATKLKFFLTRFDNKLIN